MQNESNTQQNETTSRDTMATHLVMALTALVIAVVLFSAGFYAASAIIAKMLTK